MIHANNFFLFFLLLLFFVIFLYITIGEQLVSNVEMQGISFALPSFLLRTKLDEPPL